MALMSTCVGRLGSRFSMILDPNRQQIHYGSLGLMCQSEAQMVVGLTDGEGGFCALPLCEEGDAFYNVDQHHSMTSVTYTATCAKCGVRLETQIIAPFWPQDEDTSTVPAYIIRFRLEAIDRLRWEKLPAMKDRKGTLRFAIQLPGAKTSVSKGRVKMTYPVAIAKRAQSGEGGLELEHSQSGRTTRATGKATDVIVPLTGRWKASKGVLEVPFNVGRGSQEFRLAVTSYTSDALFERFGQAMPLKYTQRWNSADTLANWVKRNHNELVDKSEAFDRLFADSGLTPDALDLAALSFQSYLMCTLWADRGEGEDWFSVWEGSCWYNSTVDVTYNEGMFYFAMWPELLEKVFRQWSHHVNDADGEARRRAIVSDDDKFVSGDEEFQFDGAVMEHDMGAGWTANGQSYHHAMPVEENSNWLLMLYAHGKWWGREALFKKYNKINRQLVDYLLWTDTTGNGFPDRGTANTIDDATPAVQYGRDNVYLGIKRLAALHAAGRMFDHCGEDSYARKCKREVRKAVKTLNAGWLGDHWGVCLDKSAKGLVDCWTRKPLPYDELPGWDAYSLYTTNGLVYLMMVDDLPPGLSADRLRQDVVNATAESMTRYGCGHSSLDQQNMWVSMNVWRDCAAGYLGVDMTDNCQRYWRQQLFANGVGAEKPNCFTETSLTNNLVWYPRNTAIFGLPMAMAQLRIRRSDKAGKATPTRAGRWPLLALASWKRGKVPVLAADRRPNGKLAGQLDGSAGRVKVAVGS